MIAFVSERDVACTRFVTKKAHFFYVCQITALSEKIVFFFGILLSSSYFCIQNLNKCSPKTRISVQQYYQ